MGEGWRKEGGRLPRVDFIITECRLFYASSVSSRFFSPSFISPPLLLLLIFILLLLLFFFLPRSFLRAPSADIHVVLLLSYGKPTLYAHIAVVVFSYFVVIL